MDNKKLAIFSIVAFVVSLIIFFTTLYLVFIKPPSTKEELPKKIETYKYDLGDFSTNIGSSGRYFKGKIVLEVTNKKAPELIDENLEKIRDYILKLIISQDVNNMMSDTGINNIKNDIKKNISKIIENDYISDVFFTDYIIQ